MGCSPPDSSIHGILQARILEWIAIPYSRASSWPRDQTQVSSIAGRFFTIWATWEAIDTLLLTNVHCLHLDSLSVLCSFMGFAKWLMSFIYYCSNIQNSCIAPKIPCTPAIHPLYLFIFYTKKAFCFSFCLAALDLSCGTWDLLLQHVGSNSLTRNWTWALLYGEHGVLSTGPAG